MNHVYQLIEVKQALDWAESHDIRRKVLFEARGNFDYDPDDADEFNPLNQPLLLKFHAVAIGTVRLDRLHDNIAAIRLVELGLHAPRIRSE